MRIPSKKNGGKDKPGSNPPAVDDVLLREIDDAYRQDQYLEFLRRYGWWILGALLAGILAFGAYLFWDAQRESRLERQSEALVSALDQAEHGNLDSADTAASAIIAETGGKGGAAIAARFLRAGIALARKRDKEAAGLYAQVANDSDAPAALRDLARIREMAARFDDLPPDQVIAALQPLAVPDNPWFASAAELVAMAYLEQGKKAEAGAVFARIARSGDAPEGLRQRARQMAGVLGVDAVDDVNEILEQQGVGAGAQPQQGPAPRP